MAKTLDPSKMTLAQLKDLRSRLDEAITDREQAERMQLRQKVEAMIASAGLSLTDLIGKGSRTGRSVPIKYRNPKDASQTWTGRGRPPRWLADAVKKGAKRESFMIR
jgi:DNA-binding protein H-NS